MKTTKATDTPQSIAEEMQTFWNEGKPAFINLDAAMKEILDFCNEIVQRDYITRLNNLGLDWASEDIDAYTNDVLNYVQALREALNKIDPLYKVIWHEIKDIRTTDLS